MLGKNDVHISIVSPVYRAEKIVPFLVEEVERYVKDITENYEIILVEDGSTDKSWEAIEQQTIKNKRVIGIKLSRNFGQHYAITAGLNAAAGEWVVVMDCDLQDAPSEIKNLYQKAQQGYDLVFAQRTLRQDNFIKIQFSKLFYKIFSYLTETKQDASIANFGIYNRKVVDAILSMKDYIRYFPTMAQWVGYKKAFLPVMHNEREIGKSSYNFRSLFKLAINNIISFSDKPLRLTIKIGFLIASTSFVVGIYYLIKYLLGSITVSGYASLILSIWFLSGIIIAVLGIIGLYVGKVFEKVKDRPMYVIEKKLNLD
jgi:polyisoprenyl-phosphate glycosyltransferase